MARTGRTLPAPRATRQGGPLGAFRLQTRLFDRRAGRLPPTGPEPGAPWYHRAPLRDVRREGDRAVFLRPQLRRRDRHLPADLPRPRQRLGGHQHRGPDGLLRPGHPRGAGLLDHQLRAYYEAHATEDGEFEVDLPAKVPANLEEEMDFDAEAITLGRADRRVLLGAPPARGRPTMIASGPLPEGTIGKTLASRVDVDVDQRRAVGGEGLGERVVELGGVVHGRPRGCRRPRRCRRSSAGRPRSSCRRSGPPRRAPATGGPCPGSRCSGSRP